MSSVARLRPSIWTADISGRLIEDISGSMKSGKVTMNQDADTQLSFAVELEARVDLKPWVTFLAPFLEVSYANGSRVTSQNGLYVVVPNATKHRWASSDLVVDGRDLTYLLAHDSFEDTYSIDVDEDPLYKARQVIESAGIPPERIRFTPRSAADGKSDVPTTFISARDWPVTASKLTIVNDILDALGYYNLWMDNTGRLVSMPAIDLNNAEADVSYSTGNGSQIVGEIDDEPSITSFANVIIITAGSPVANDMPPKPVPPTDPVMGVGRTVRVTESLNLRTAAGLTNSVTTVMPAGTAAKVTAGPTTADGYTWWQITAQVKGIGSRTGWCAGDWLALVKGDPDPVTAPPPPAPIRAIRINDNPASETSTVSLGRRWVRAEEPSDIETQAQADAYADRLMQESLTYYRKLTLRTLPDPRRNLHEVYDLNVRNRAGDAIVTGLWYCRGWELGFTPSDAAMTHTCHRIEPWQAKEAVG